MVVCFYYKLKGTLVAWSQDTIDYTLKRKEEQVWSNQQEKHRLLELRVRSKDGRLVKFHPSGGEGTMAYATRLDTWCTWPWKLQF